MIKYIFILTIPIIYFLYGLKSYFSSMQNAPWINTTGIIHEFLVYQFISIIIIIMLRKFSFIMKNIKKNFSIYLVGLFLILLKFKLLLLSELTFDIIYIFKIFVSIFIELVPLLIIKPYINKRLNKIFYIFLILLIISLNIGIAIYYYYTSELIEPLLFSNINFSSINGFFINYNILNLLFIGCAICLFIWIVNYFLVTYESYNSLEIKNYYKNILVCFLVLFVTSEVLYFSDKFTIGKLSPLYGYERLEKDRVVNKITANAIFTYAKSYYEFQFPKQDNIKIVKITFNTIEKEILKNLGLSENEKSNNSIISKKYNRIIIIQFESLSIDFINYYNNKIPKEATPYFNYLLKNYFHLNNYFTSNMPTDFGWTAVLKSKLDLNEEGASLFSIFKSDYNSYYIMASSKFYGLKSKYYQKAFKFNHWFYKENLQLEYGNKFSGWGFHNDIVFDKAVKILKQNRKKKIILSTETADFHQPGPYRGFLDNELPLALRNSEKLIKSIYWIDQTFQKFMEKLEKENLFDAHTLIIVSADHNPHPGIEFKKYALKSNYKRLARIPLIFITKNHDFKEFSNIENEIYSQVDLLPTILAIQGGDNNNSGFFGSNILTGHIRPYLGKYRDVLYYFNDNGLKYNCNIDANDKSKECAVIEKYFYKRQRVK